MVSVDVKHHFYLPIIGHVKVEVAVPNSPYCLCGRKAKVSKQDALGPQKP